MLEGFAIHRFGTDPHREYRALLHGKTIGYAYLWVGSDHVEQVFVDAEYRRKGIASMLYDAIEADLGIKLRPSELSVEGDAFWRNRMRSKDAQETQTYHA